MKQAFLVYPGLGKTTLSNKDHRFEDIESKLFKDMSLKKYIGTKDYPNYRGQKVISFNPEYPKNLQEYALKLLEQNKIILLVYKKDGQDLLEALNIDYDIIIPSRERLKLLEKDYIDRNDDEEYIERNITIRYEESIKSAEETGKNVFYLDKNEYLIDFFSKLENKSK